VPSDDEWSVLIDFLGGKEIAAKKMKSLEGWSDNFKGTNESRFNGLPGGNRMYYGDYLNIGSDGFWWCTLEDGIENAWGFYLDNTLENADGEYPAESCSKKDGLSVRCLKD
jgi:uncharacterized protein (TIGR02145 family)